MRRVYDARKEAQQIACVCQRHVPRVMTRRLPCLLATRHAAPLLPHVALIIATPRMFYAATCRRMPRYCALSSLAIFAYCCRLPRADIRLLLLLMSYAAMAPAAR